MEWAVFTGAGDQPIHASKADYKHYKGFLGVDWIGVFADVFAD
ncbi:MAG TPA: hypothetical protein V6D30_20240 [Leptolyngbyaceae cyanobacterium]|jgi:hypothetical protein